MRLVITNENDLTKIIDRADQNVTIYVASQQLKDRGEELAKQRNREDIKFENKNTK